MVMLNDVCRLTTSTTSIEPALIGESLIVVFYLRVAKGHFFMSYDNDSYNLCVYSF